jgi:hypothetical protein
VRYSGHATLTGTPEFDVHVHAQPLRMDCGLRGAARARIGRVHARVGRVPIMVAIPFLGAVQTVGAVGPFDLHTEPVDVALEELELGCSGTLGEDGLSGHLRGEVKCNWKIDMHGVIPGRVARASLEFAEHEEDEPER